MKRLIFPILVVSTLAVAVPGAKGAWLVDGDQVRVYNDVTPSTNGGPFRLVPEGGSIPEFHTFCLEVRETFNPGKKYEVTVGTEAIGGGGGPNPDPLDIRTAYLYKSYIDGSLVGTISYGTYSYNWQGGANLDDLTAVQDAIWYLEQEIAAPAVGSTADILVGWLNTLDASVLNTAWHVRVINLWDVGYPNNMNHARQSMLTIGHAPEPASMAIWGLITCVFGGAFCRRRRQGS